MTLVMCSLLIGLGSAMFKSKIKPAYIKQPIALLYSGGLDSYCSFRLLQRAHGFDNVIPVYIPTDSVYAHKEQDAVMKTMWNIGVKLHKLPPLEVQNYTRSDGFVPLRNLLFVALAGMAGYDRVALAAVRGEASLDKSERFFDDVSGLFTFLLGQPMQIYAPHGHLTKAELVEQALAHAVVTPEELELTVSCYSGEHLRCGQCQSCFRRWVAMTKNGIEEEYAHDIIEYAKQQAHPESWLDILKDQPIDRWVDLFKNNADVFSAMLRSRQ